VLVVDPLSLHREAVAALLNSSSGLTAVPCAAIRGDIQDALRQHDPAVVLLGLDAPDDGAVSGMQLLREHRARVLLLTGTRDAAVHARAIELGALGVVSRHQNGMVLCDAIKAVARGEIWLEWQCAPAVVGCLVRRQGARDLETVKVDSLTPREREIVALVTEGMRNKQIADRLCISEATVRNHLTSILSKLELTDRFDLAVYAFRRGMAKVTLVESLPASGRSPAHHQSR
jgi:two-component system, NarL family, nitrate/nitrite response regulator NarL